MPQSPPEQQSHDSIDFKYSQDMNYIIRSLFKERNTEGKKLKRYLSHVRIVEDSKYPSSRPPANSPQTHKKQRLLILSVDLSGKIELHKAKQSSNHIVQIGRTWDFEELVNIRMDEETSTGFIFTMSKDYYWETDTAEERKIWLASLSHDLPINYDPAIDDSLTLEKKMLQHLEKLQYKKIQSLDNVELALSSSVQQCNAIDPIIDTILFNTNNINLFVETTNKKLLKNELSDYLRLSSS